MSVRHREGKMMSESNTLKQSFAALDSSVQELWLERAIEHLQKSGYSWTAEYHDVLVYITAVYLFQISLMAKTKPEYPFYVVHSMDKEWRFISQDYREAYKRFVLADRKERVALFFWRGKNVCEKLTASDGYVFDRDFGG